MKRLAALVMMGICGLTLSAGEPGKAPTDSRLGPLKNYNGYFPWTPPASKEAWEKRRQEVRAQVLVANGLWPMPEKTPLKPVIHGMIERDGYTIQKVFFASYPGHYVTGNLYRPTGKTGKLPAILSPHGHWPNGRFYTAGDKEIANQIKQGAEKTEEGARYPLQARCAQLARMGCVVFFYDMVGYADSKQIPHRGGFTDAEAELRLQSFLGLQTYNSIRAFDFLASLPDVDAKRIGVTGASGGGTQTFILCAVDDRPAAAFPAVMVSTAMQGGCICENCTYLRVGTGNIELAGLFAPKPLGMAAANDWTKDIETKGLPELKALYKLYDAEDNVMAKAYLQFGHNYNQVSRELMYNFFNKHLKLGHKAPVKEQAFQPVPPKELSVFDAEHPLPKDAVDIHDLRRHMTRESNKQMLALRDGLENGDNLKKSYLRFQNVVATALRTMITDSLPAASDVVMVAKGDKGDKEEKDGILLKRTVLSRKGQGEAIPAVGLHGADFDGTVVVWIHPAGLESLWDKGQLVPAAKSILQKKSAILAIDAFGTGTLAKGKDMAINKNYAGYTFGYNRPLLANRVHDILTAVAFARGKLGKQVHLVGWEKAGPWVLLARGLCGDAVTRTAADMNQFRFENILSMSDEMLLPGALKYGGLPALAAVSAPHSLFVHNSKGTGADQWLPRAYSTATKNLRLEDGAAAPDTVIAWLIPGKP